MNTFPNMLNDLKLKNSEYWRLNVVFLLSYYVLSHAVSNILSDLELHDHYSTNLVMDKFTAEKLTSAWNDLYITISMKVPS